MRGWVQFFVDRWQFTVVLFGMLAALGWVSWSSIGRAEDPTFPAPVFNVVVVFPGAPPEDVEQLVVDPLEERLGELRELKEIRSRVEDGLALVSAEFYPEADADRKHDEVMREVNALRPQLPADLRRLDVLKYSSAEVNILQVALVSETAPMHELERRAESLEDRLEALPGVRGAEVWGVREREIAVELDLGRLAALGIAPGEVLRAVGAANVNIPGGSVDAGGRRFNVRSGGEFASLDEVRDVVVRSAGDRATYLRDVARVDWGYADATHLARVDGRRAVFVTATQEEDTNIQAVRDGAWAELDAFEKTLPPTVKLARGFDQSANVGERLGHLGRDFAIAILLVMITLLPLGLRAAGIVMVSIPLSIAMGLTLLYWTGFTVNQLSIVGFVIALGLLVDDSIVVVENIARYLREGLSRREAALRGTEQIAVAVLGCTATLIFAFAPLVFLPGLPGRYIRVMPLAVIFTVVASLVISLTIIPWMAAHLLSRHENPEGNWFMRALQGAIRRSYAPVLDRALARPGRTLAVSAAIVAGAFAMVPAVGFSLFPKAGTPQFLVDVRMPDGTSLEETDRAVRFAERTLAQRPEVRTVLANTGRDNPQIYYNVIPRNENPGVGQLFVLLKHYDPVETPRMLDGLRERFARYPGARIEVREFENGPPIDAPIALRLEGPELDTLRALAGRVEATMKQTPGTLYVNNPVRLARTDLAVQVDRRKAGMLGIPTAELDRTVRLGIAGVDAGVYRDESGDEHEIRVRLPGLDRPTPAALDRVYLASYSGASVPLAQVAEVRFATTQPLIQHFDRQRAVTVTSHVRSGYNTDRVTRDVLSRLAGIELPAGYRLVPAGEIESRQESFGGVGTAIVVAVFAILAILVLEFRTFRGTLIVATVIPLGIVGGILALWLTGYTLSFTATIGFVALVGIEIKTSILLVDFTNQLRAQGMGIEEAIRHAGEVRFVPIVLTSLTAIGGLLPLALEGSGLYSPLAWVIIGGLISSTLLARLVTPVVYKLMPPAIEPLSPAV